MIATLLALAVLLLVIGLAICYLIREKQRGNACIGCPYGGKCQRGCQGRDKK